MIPLSRLHQRLSAGLVVFVAVLLFSATAVEVAPQAIDVLQDLGWLPPDVADAPAEAAALSSPDESRRAGSATIAVAEVDGAALERLGAFTDWQPDALDYPISYRGSADTTAQPSAGELLEGIVTLNPVPDVATVPSRMPRSRGGSASAPALGSFAAQAMIDAGTLPDEFPVTPTAEEGEAGARPASTSGLAITGGTSDGTTAGVGPTEFTPTTSAASAIDRTNDVGTLPVTTGNDAGSTPVIAPTETPSESGIGANASLEVSPVAVPEPTTLLTFGAGLLGLVWFGKRKVAR